MKTKGSEKRKISILVLSTTMVLGVLFITTKHYVPRATEIQVEVMKLPHPLSYLSGQGTTWVDYPYHPVRMNYQVKIGDTLTKISERYEVSVSDLMSFNKLPDDRIYAGSWLQIPVID